MRQGICHKRASYGAAGGQEDGLWGCGGAGLGARCRVLASTRPSGLSWPSRAGGRPRLCRGRLRHDLGALAHAQSRGKRAWGPVCWDAWGGGVGAACCSLWLGMSRQGCAQEAIRGRSLVAASGWVEWRIPDETTFASRESGGGAVAAGLSGQASRASAVPPTVSAASMVLASAQGDAHVPLPSAAQHMGWHCRRLPRARMPACPPAHTPVTPRLVPPPGCATAPLSFGVPSGAQTTGGWLHPPGARFCPPKSWRALRGQRSRTRSTSRPPQGRSAALLVSNGGLPGNLPPQTLSTYSIGSTRRHRAGHSQRPVVRLPFWHVSAQEGTAHVN